jgi:hypothetical protein
MPADLAAHILAILHQDNKFRTEYDFNGYLEIISVGNNNYEVKIESVSFFDQPMTDLLFFEEKELIHFINQQADKIGK